MKSLAAVPQVRVCAALTCQTAAITDSQEDFMMKLSDKIIRLRKTNGWSQEVLAEKMDVSRQAVSRWEGGTAQPDAANILQLSRLFDVTTDYLLNDAYESDHDLPKVKEARKDGLHQIMIVMVTLEVMIWILQFVAIMVLQSRLFGILSLVPFVAVVGGFAYTCQKRSGEADETTRGFCRKFYQISAWLGAYFPVRLVLTAAVRLYPRPFHAMTLECVIFAVYLLTAALITWQIRKDKRDGVR